MTDSKRYFKYSVRRQTLIRPNKGHKKICIFLMDGAANARAVLNAQLDAWHKENDDDHEYRGNLKTHYSKWHTGSFPKDFQWVP